MSFGVQSQTATIAEMSLFAAEADEAEQQQQVDSSLPDAKGGLKTTSKNYTFTPRPQNTPHAQKTREYVQTFGPKIATKADAMAKSSPMNLATSTYRPNNFSQPQKAANAKSHSSQPQQKTAESKPQTTPTAKNAQTSAKAESKPTQAAPRGAQPSLAKTHAETTRGLDKAQTRHEKRDVRQESKHSTPLPSRQWSKQETKQWWDSRYTQKERQGDQKGQDQQENQEEEEKKFRISKSSSIDSKNKPANRTTNQLEGNEKVKKPLLSPPRPGVFALYYILTKIGITSDGASNFAYKNEIELVDEQTTATHKKRLEGIREAIKKETENARWGIAAKAFSWIGSLLGIIAGIALVATGVGVVAGAMLIVGSTLQLANEIMELSGGWKKVAELLPGDDPEKKRAVLSWIQIGIGVLCLILSGVGIIWGGFSNFGTAMQTAMAVFGGVANMGHGVTTIGEGMTGFFFRDKLGDIKQYEVKLARLKHQRQDLMEKVEWGIDRLEQLFEDLARALDFEVELFRADQMLYRR